jgi:deazaflavin-dependent oxidoreductase (nitroreductase family)
LQYREHAGYPRHPDWYHNLRANSDVTLDATPMRANVVSDEAERHRLWTAADRVFPPYAKYRRLAAKAGRTIPLVQLTAR